MMRAAIVMVLGTLAVAGSVADGIGAALLQAQAAPPADAPAFEVASVKPNKSGQPFIQIGGGPGQFRATNVPLRLLIQNAYQVQPFQLIGGPGWISDERFDIVAKPPEGVPLAPGQNQLMMRALLAERFKLAVHKETREMPIYALVLARNDGKLGSQIEPAKVDCAAMLAARSSGAGGPQGPPPAPLAPGQRPQCGMMMRPGGIAAGGQTIEFLARTISQQVSRIVLDRTGLTGAYDFNLEFTPDQMPQFPGGAPPPGAPPLPPIDPNGPSLFTAIQEQLGLKLDSQKGPVEVIVIDHVDQPTPD
jgi:uncharacterized protein (TIGR03435 family)